MTNNVTITEKTCGCIFRRSLGQGVALASNMRWSRRYPAVVS